jgi:predicted dehydrogenase
LARLRIGIVGGGTIAQVEHIPNALRLRDTLDVKGVADPSATARRFISEKFGLRTFESAGQLLDEKLDAVVVCSPDPLHEEQVRGALGRGLHVFCEKPLCYSPAEIEGLMAARDAAGKVLQVGYMKRFDPSYVQAIAQMPGTAETLRYVSVEVNDPDAWPFIAHHPTGLGRDVPAHLIAEVREKQLAQIRRAVADDLDPTAMRGFATAYCSSLVHDVNAVHGLLDALGIGDGEVVGASIFAGGDGGQGAVSLMKGRALWNMCHLTVPSLADYRERISLYFDDAVLELEFQSPWLDYQPTRLSTRTSKGHLLSRVELRPGFANPYFSELESFAASCLAAAPVRNPAEEARRDQALLCALAARHARGVGRA